MKGGCHASPMKLANPKRFIENQKSSYFKNTKAYTGIDNKHEAFIINEYGFVFGYSWPSLSDNIPANNEPINPNVARYNALYWLNSAVYSGYIRAKNIAGNSLIANKAINRKQPAPINILYTSFSPISLKSYFNLPKI